MAVDKSCGSCNELKVTNLNGRTTIHVPEAYGVERLGDLDTQIEQTMALADQLGVMPRKPISRRRPDPLHPVQTFDSGLIPNSKLSDQTGQSEAATHVQSTRSERVARQFILSESEVAEELGLIQPRGPFSSTLFTLAQTDAAAVLPGGGHYQVTGESGPIKEISDLPADWPLGEKGAFDGWVTEWANRKKNGESSITGDGNAPQARVPVSPEEKFELIPAEGGDGCSGKRQIRRFKWAGRFMIEFNQWLIGGYTKYAPGSAKTREDIEEEARHTRRQKLRNEGIIANAEVGEPDTVSTRAAAKRRELLAECADHAEKLRVSQATRKSIAIAYNAAAIEYGSPLTLLDPFIRSAISGFTCPQDCALSYDLLGTIYDTGANEDDVRADCSPDARIGTEKWTEQRGTDSDGNPVYVTIELEQWAVIMRIVIEPWWEVDADVAIYCKAKS